MQVSGGSRNRPAVIYPDNNWTWPDLRTDIRAVVKLEYGSCSANEAAGELGPHRAEDITIKSEDGARNGFYVKGGEKYVLSGATIEMIGNGSDDFTGVGAGVMVDEGGELVLRGCDIQTAGVVRPCTLATRGGVLRIYGCRLTASGGTLPEGYVFRPGRGMLVPPPALGLSGNCRAHLSMDHSRTYFYDSEIVAEGWGALSTDAGNGYVYLEANRCGIEVRSPGYAASADGDCHVVLNDCRLETASHGLIMSGLSECALRNTSVRSGRHFAMIHNVKGVPTEVAELTVTGGEIETARECFLLKSANTYLDLVGVTIKSGCNVLLRAAVNFDEYATRVGSEPVFGNNLVLSDMELEGDIINEDTDRTLTVTLNGTLLRGAVKEAYLTMDPSSRWISSGDSTVIVMGDAAESQFDAPPGVTITADVGEDCRLRSCVLPLGGTLLVRQRKKGES